MARLRAGWRALGAAYARMTPDTPPLTDANFQPEPNESNPEKRKS